MSTPKNADQARAKIDEIAALRREVLVDPTRADEIHARMEQLREELRAPDRPGFDNITEGLIASTLNPLMAQDTSLTSQGVDPRGS